MKITVTFDSLEEFQKHMKLAPEVDIIVNAPTPKAQKELVEKTAEIAPAEPLPADPVESAPAEETKQDAPKINESYRVEVRHTLAELNKKQTGNPAKALIAETGYKRLTEVPLELLPGIMAKAKEALNA